MLPWAFSAFAKADLWSADRPLASAASTPVAAACSTKTWQASVTWVATLAPKASTSRASWGGWAAATFATFDGLGEGLGAGVWPLPLRGGGHPAQPPPRLVPASSGLFPAVPPWVHTAEPNRQWRPPQKGGGHTHQPGGCPPPCAASATLPSPYTPPPTKNTPSKGNKISFGGGRSSQMRGSCKMVA